MVENVIFPNFDDTEEKKPKEVKLALEEEWKKEQENPKSENQETEEEETTQEDTQALKEELEKVMAERDDYLNHLKRLQAEFDNFRKRTQREKLEMRDYMVQEFIERLLDVVDNMERALNPNHQNVDVESYRSGVDMVYQQFMSILSDFGLAKVESVGQKFDPQFHEAVAQLPTDEHEAGTIVAEITPGYILKDRVIRAPKVQVASPLIEDNNQE